MNTAKLISLVVMAIMSVGLIACSASSPVADPMPQGQSYSGLWYSPQYEHMYLHQDGDRVVGVYTYRGGGEIEGKVEGNLLLFDWDQPGDRDAARRDMQGKGFFHLVERGDGVELEGQWGYNEDREGAPWEAEYIREWKDSDPRTLQELRDRR